MKNSLHVGLVATDYIVGVVLLSFVLIVAVTIFGLVTGRIDRKFMTALVSSVLVMTAGAVLTVFKTINFDEGSGKLGDIIQELHQFVPDADSGDYQAITGGVRNLIESEVALRKKAEDGLRETINENSSLKVQLTKSKTDLANIRNEKQVFIDYLRRAGLNIEKDPPTAKGLIQAMLESEDLKDAFISNLKNHDFYPVEEPEYVETKIKFFEPKHDVSVKLLKLMENREGPFISELEVIQLSVPSGNDIPDGVCVVRNKGPYVGHIMKISANEFDPTPVILKAIQLHEANPDDSGAELVQVNFATAKKILGIESLPAKSKAWAKSIPQ